MSYSSQTHTSLQMSRQTDRDAIACIGFNKNMGMFWCFDQNLRQQYHQCHNIFFSKTKITRICYKQSHQNLHRVTLQCICYIFNPRCPLITKFLYPDTFHTLLCIITLCIQSFQLTKTAVTLFLLISIKLEYSCLELNIFCNEEYSHSSDLNKK